MCEENNYKEIKCIKKQVKRLFHILVLQQRYEQTVEVYVCVRV